MTASLRLGDNSFKIGSGATPRGGKNSYLSEGPFSLIRSQNVYSDGFKKSGLAYINNDQAERLKNVEVLENDILLNITGDSVARVCQVDASVLPARVNQHVAIIRPNPETIDARFLRYFLASPLQQNLLLALASAGATRPALTKGMIENLLIPDIELTVQRKISSLLGAIDDKIAMNQQMNETLEGMARAIFKDWFVDFGPVKAKEAGQHPIGPDGEPMYDKLLALFPEQINKDTNLPFGWIVSEIQNEVSIFGGSTPSTKEQKYWEGGTYYWTTPKDLSNLKAPFLLDTERKITKEGIDKITSGQLPIGTLLMSSRAPVGYLAISNVPISVNQGYIAMVCDKRISNIYAWCWADTNMELIKSHANGSTFQEISKKNFRPLPVLVPSRELLSVFNEIVQPLFNRIILNLKENTTLHNLRDTLLPKLMSGEINVEELKNIGIEKVKPSNVVPLHKTDLLGDIDGSPLSKPINTLERDAVMVAAAVRILQVGDTVVGNVRYQKAVYFMRRLNEWSLQNFKKKAAGPYDEGLRDAADEAVRRGYLFNAVQKGYSGKKPARNINQIDSLIIKYGLEDALDWISANLNGKKVEDLELWATVDMAMQDKRKLGQSITAESIRMYIGSITEWKDKLKKPHFSLRSIKDTIDSLNKVIG